MPSLEGIGLLGADVTVLDLSHVQLERDSFAAEHYGCSVQLELGDMRDLSRFPDASFDIVWQAHSVNFVPDVREVFVGVSRILSAAGLYRLEVTNPFIHGTWEGGWTSNGYLLAGPYRDEEVQTEDPWDFVDDDGNRKHLRGPREFRHTFSSVVNGLISARLKFLGLWEDCNGDEGATPGSWDHFKQYGAPWITVLAQRNGNA